MAETGDDMDSLTFTPSYHLEWLVGDQVVFEPDEDA